MQPALSSVSLPIPEMELEERRRGHTEAAHTAEESEEARRVHPDSLKLYKACGGKFAWTRYIPIFGRAIECYGPKFVLTLDFTELMSRGISYFILQNAAQPMFVNRYKCSAMEFQRFNNVSTMGWSIKPFTALISDSFPLFHYTKRWYLFGSAVLGVLGCVIYGSLPSERSSATTAAVMAFLAGYGQANLDILSEGLYSRLIRRYSASGPSLVASLWWLLGVAGIISALIQGPLSDGGMQQVGVYVGGAALLITAPIFAANTFGELTNREERMADFVIEQGLRRGTSDIATKHPLCEPKGATDQDGTLEEPLPNEVALESDTSELLDGPEEIPSYCGGMIEFNKSVLITNYRLTVYAMVITCGVMANVIATMNGSRWPLLITCCVVVAILIPVSFWALPRVVAKASLFVFLARTSYVNLLGPLQTYFVASAADNPGGPNFSYFFFNTVSASLGSAAWVLGVSLFPCIFAKRTFRLAFITTTFLLVLGSVGDLFIVKRWNLKVGIPDHYAYVFGDAMAYQVAYMLNWMPMVVLLAQLCPRGQESTVFSMLAAANNLGESTAAQIGSLLMGFVLPVDTTTAPFDFSNLPWLIVIGHFILPLLQIPAALLLIPKCRICDPVNPEKKADEVGDGDALSTSQNTSDVAK